MRLPDVTLQQVLETPSPDWRSLPELRDAAVLAPIYEANGQDLILYTRRRDDLKSHAGEVSFPGGGREGDETALECALRESQEEIGLDPASVTVLGRLPERRSIGGYRVHVFVGRIPTIEGLTIDPGEVQHMLSIPVGELMRKERWEYRDMSDDKRRYRVPFFPHEGDMLWGLTARLTLDLLERLP